MPIKNSRPNIGNIDRVLRIAFGMMCIMNATSNRNFLLKTIHGILGASLLNTGIKGYDPVFDKLNISTIPKASNNILNTLKQAAPGQGINPILTQQASPKKQTKGMENFETISHALTIK